MKKTIPIALSGCLLTTMIISMSSIYATDFKGQEDKYKTICTSSTLSKNDESVCKEFNTYLKEKNKDLDASIENTRKEVENSKNDVNKVDHLLKTLSSDITSKESEITYLNSSITTLEKNLTNQETKVRERMYTMQSYINSNSFVDFIFGASNFSDMYSRLSSIEELTSYDKTLIRELVTTKKEIEKQKETVASALASLDTARATQETLQTTYLENYAKLNSEALAKEKEALANANTTEKIDDALAAFAKASSDSKIDGITSATPPANPSAPTPPSNPNLPDVGQPDVTPPSSSSELGLAIANNALAKQGSPYVWGASGPSNFDCSGLVYWAHSQAGVAGGRTTAAGLSGRGKAVAYNDMQAGDIITFVTNGSSVSHVGIYIGGGKMVHAPVPGQTVQVAKLNVSYWQNTYYNSRRLY